MNRSSRPTSTKSVVAPKAGQSSREELLQYLAAAGADGSTTVPDSVAKSVKQAFDVLLSEMPGERSSATRGHIEPSS
jgi:hypothetical protein